MNITISINESKLTEHIEALVAEQIAEQIVKEIKGHSQNSLSYLYHAEIREIIREVMRKNYDSLAKEAVSAAAKSIENRAVKNKLLKMLEE